MDTKDKILIIDDELLNRETLTKIFSEAGYQVSTSGNEKETFEILNKELPGLILLDMDLSNESGLDLLKKIKKEYEFKHIFIVLISGKIISSEEQANGIELGADGYITRPIARRELVARIEAFFRHKRTLDSLRKSEETLAATVEQYKFLFENANDGIIVHDLEGNVIDVNQRMLNFINLTKGEFIKQNIQERPITSSEEEQRNKRAYKQLLREGFVEFDTEFLKKSGEVIVGNVSSRIIEIGNRKVVHTIVRDITSRKIAEEALVESRARLIVAQQIGRVGDFRWVLDNNEVTISEGLEDLLQYSKTEINNFEQLNTLIHHPEDRQKITQWLNSSVEAGIGRLSPFEYRVVRADRKVLHVRSMGVVEREMGKPVRVIATIQDITKRKRAEMAVKKSESKLRDVIDATPFPVALVDTNDDEIIYWSQSAKELFGHTAPTSAIWYELAYPDPDYRAEAVFNWKTQLEKAKHRGEAINTGEYKVTCKDGSVRICELHAKFIPGNLIVTFNDITEKKKASTALKNSEKKFRSVFNNSNIGMTLRDTKGKLIDVNKEFADMLGFEIEELSEMNFADFTHPDDISKEITLIKQILNGEIENYRIEKRYITKEKKTIWIDIVVTGRINNKGEVDMLMGMALDITEGKKAEEALRHSEEIFRHFMEHSPIYVFFKDKNIRSLKLSKNFEQLLNKPLTELIGKNMDELFPPELAKSMVADDIRILNEGKTVEVDEKLNGRFYTTIKFPIIIDGKAEYLAGYTIDITDRKIAEEAIVVSQKRYQTLFDDSPVPLWEEDFSELFKCIEQIRATNVSDLRGYFDANPKELINCSQKVKIIDVNEATLKLYEAENKEELLGNLEKTFTQKSLEMFKEGLLAITSGKTDFQAESEVRTLTGEPRNIFLKLIIDTEETGIYKALLATIDITDRKKVEMELKKHHEELEELVKERTKELEEKNNYLERVNNAMIDREFRIKELKDEVQFLKENKR
jgi:PAS domain S-box-containing protein